MLPNDSSDILQFFEETTATHLTHSPQLFPLFLLVAKTEPLTPWIPLPMDLWQQCFKLSSLEYKVWPNGLVAKFSPLHVPGSQMSARSYSCYSTTQPVSACGLGKKAVEDGPKLWDPAPTWVMRKLQSETVDGWSDPSISLLLSVNLTKKIHL